MPGNPRRQAIIAHHLVLTGYGHWFPNDPRGSGSDALRNEELHDLGPIHHGRKTQQPPREELRRFFRQAAPRLEHPTLWFDESHRKIAAESFGATIARHGYTCYAAAVLKNHAHLLVRVHRDHDQVIWDRLATDSRVRFQEQGIAPAPHPLWADRPYGVFCHTPQDVRARIQYIEENFAKEGLPFERYPFVEAYDGWPLHKRR